MHPVIRFLRTTMLGGLVFVMPFIVLLLIAREALRHVSAFLKPVANLFPFHQVGGLNVSDILALISILAACFLLGLFLTTRPGRVVGDQVEAVVTRRVPGFMFIKSLAMGMTGFGGDQSLPVALVSFDDAKVLGFIVERNANGLVTLFVPSAPTPAVGSIYFMEEHRVQLLDASVMSAVSCVLRLGVSSNKLFTGLPPEAFHDPRRGPTP